MALLMLKVAIIIYVKGVFLFQLQFCKWSCLLHFALYKFLCVLTLTTKKILQLIDEVIHSTYLAFQHPLVKLTQKAGVIAELPSQMLSVKAYGLLGFLLSVVCAIGLFSTQLCFKESDTARTPKQILRLFSNPQTPLTVSASLCLYFESRKEWLVEHKTNDTGG